LYTKQTLNYRFNSDNSFSVYLHYRRFSVYVCTIGYLYNRITSCNIRQWPSSYWQFSHKTSGAAF